MGQGGKAQELTLEALNDDERAVLAELVEFGHRTELARGTMETGARTVVEILDARLTPTEVHELCTFARVAATKSPALQPRRGGGGAGGDDRPGIYDAEDFYAWCFEPEPDNRRPGPRVSMTAKDAEHARQLLKTIQRRADLKRLFELWDSWRRTPAQH